MRFAQMTALTAALLAVPVGMELSGPSMSEEQFLNEVRCVAYVDVSRATDLGLGGQKMRLNSEAARQPAGTVRAAVLEVDAIAARAAEARTAADAVRVREARAAACAQAETFVRAPTIEPA